jgi:hypothetical protein
MKTFLWILGLVAFMVGSIMFIQAHTEEYQITGICRKTLITYDHKSQQTDYTVIIEYADGDVEEHNFFGSKNFFSYKEGETYYFTRTRWVWNKNK